MYIFNGNLPFFLIVLFYAIVFFFARYLLGTYCVRTARRYVLGAHNTPPREAVHPNPHFQDALFSEIESEILSEIQSGIILEIFSGIFRRRSRRKIRSLLAQLNNDLIGDECRRLNQAIDKRFL